MNATIEFDRYLACLYLNDKKVVERPSNDLKNLTTEVLLRLESENNSAYGEIIDRFTKRIIRRFRKAPSE